MKFDSFRTPRSPLMRRLARHAGLATIYRLPDGPEPLIPVAPPATASAYLWPVQPAPEDAPEGLPADKTQPEMGLEAQRTPPVTIRRAPAPAPVQRSPSNSAVKPSAPVLRPSAPTPSDQPAAPAGKSTPLAVQPARVSPPASALTQQPPATEPTGAGEKMDDATWNRLETIFRRHQEQESAAEEGAQPGSRPASSPDSLPARTLPPASAAVQPTPAAIQRKPADQTSAEAGQPAATAGQQPAEGERSPSAAEHPSTEVKQPPEQTNAPQIEDSLAVEDTLLPGWPVQEVESGEVGDFESADPSADATGLVQRLPLEAVWPVERSAPLTNRLLATRPEQPGPDPVREQPRMEALRSRLSQVTPAQVTDSSVELVPTTRPRPSPLKPANAQAVTSNAAEPARELPADRPEIDLPGAESPHPGDFAAEAEMPSQSALPSAPSSVQRTPASPVPSQPPAQPGMPPRAVPIEAGRTQETAPSRSSVPTGIGDLPSDLWTLIGQPVPGSEGEPEANLPAGEPVSTPIQVAPASPSTDGYIQREPADETGAADRAAPSSETGAAPAETTGSAANPVDIDQLARSVYAEVRRRLNQEWERMRRR